MRVETLDLNIGRLYSDGNQSAEREFQSWFRRNFSYTWEYQQHIGASSQKIVLILHSSVHGKTEMTVLGDIVILVKQAEA